MTMDPKAQGQSAQQTTTGEASLLDDLLNEANYKPNNDGYDLVKKGISHLITDLLQPTRTEQRVDRSVIETMVAEIDQRLSAQINEILHHADFMKLESSWRGLKYLIDQVDFRENIRVEMLNVSKEDLINDFEDSPEIVKSGLYKTVYSAEYGTFGGKPIGLMVGNYEFGGGHQDIMLLQKLASVSAMAHAPFISGTSPQMFGIDSWEKLPNLKDLTALFEGPQYARWQSFRESEDARYVGLTAPRFLLRIPYGANTVPVKAFAFEEDVQGKHQHYLWGNSAIALATRVADSFAKYRWCPNIIGPQAGGAVENLPLYQYTDKGELVTQIPTEVQLTERREYEMSEEGFIGLTFRKGSDNACFFSANSCQKPKYFGQSKEGREAETNYRLSTQLPYMFIMNRLAHYLKVLQREQIGTWKERADLERELNKWINQYVADMDNPSEGVRSRRPLRQAQIKVEDVEGQPGWYRCDMKVRPHFKYMGASFTLSLVGKLDKE